MPNLGSNIIVFLYASPCFECMFNQHKIHDWTASASSEQSYNLNLNGILILLDQVTRQ